MPTPSMKMRRTDIWGKGEKGKRRKGKEKRAKKFLAAFLRPFRLFSFSPKKG
jgi:hypothetical protein